MQPHIRMPWPTGKRRTAGHPNRRRTISLQQPSAQGPSRRPFSPDTGKKATLCIKPCESFGQSMTNKRERSEEHTSELQSLMRISYAVFCLKKKKIKNTNTPCMLVTKTNSYSNHKYIYKL